MDKDNRKYRHPLNGCSGQGLRRSDQSEKESVTIDERRAKGGKALLHMVGCISGLAALWHDGHTLSVHRMTTDVPLHKSVVRSKTAVYHSMVYLSLIHI